MLDPLVLRTLVSGLLTDAIGTYSLDTDAGTVTQSAIAVLPDLDVGYNYPPSGTTVTGLEVVIYKPTADYVPIMGGKMQPATWEVRLKQWDTNASLTDLMNALVPQLASALIYCRFLKPGSIPPNPQKGIVEQGVIKFTEYLA